MKGVVYAAYANYLDAYVAYVLRMENGMGRKPRKELIEETRAKLIAAGRGAFATNGYAEASMDEFTAAVGLTRGALYHHFGDKKGLLAAVIAQLDDEVSSRLQAISDGAETKWCGFIDENVAYMQMALEPEIQRIMLLDGPAVLGATALAPNQNKCIAATRQSLDELVAEGTIHHVDTEATARLINGAVLSASLWIASSQEPEATSQRAIKAFAVMAAGLLKDEKKESRA
jgi:AcrR family transcriptional regulator